MKPVLYNEEFAIKFDEPIMPATVVSRLLGIPVWALKRIDKEGVVSPPRKKIRCASILGVNLID
jgi:hypothetical protein